MILVVSSFGDFAVAGLVGSHAVAVAAAILDRLMDNAIVFNIRGPSWRLREHDSLQIAATNPEERTTR